MPWTSKLSLTESNSILTIFMLLESKEERVYFGSWSVTVGMEWQQQQEGATGYIVGAIRNQRMINAHTNLAFTSLLSQDLSPQTVTTIFRRGLSTSINSI